MAKKPQSREELLAALEAIDNSTEIATLQAQVATLTEERDALVSNRKELERTVRHLELRIDTVRKAVSVGEKAYRIMGPANPDHAATQEAGAIAARMEMAETNVGILEGTHDPATGLPFTDDTRPQRDLCSGTPKVTKGELERFFPSLSGASVDVITTSDTPLDAEPGDAKTALEIGVNQ
jgi:hypothetical protein